MPEFMPGLQLSELFFREVVQPKLEAHFSHLLYSAALIGEGSEVLGFDTPISMDHHWGPRLKLFVSENDYQQHHAEITTFFSEHLPYTFKGFSTHFGAPDHFGVQLLETIDSGPVNHRIEISTVRGFFEDYLGINPYTEIKPVDWLILPEHRLLSVTAGQVYSDGLDELHPIREKLIYYPEDVWRYLLAAQWLKISQEEAFVGRCGDVGDELGSRIIAARLVNVLMKLCFLMEKKYAPYSKWFGTAFSRLKCANALSPVLMHVVHTDSCQDREMHLSTAYHLLAEMFNALDITTPMPVEVSQFYARPYRVIHGERFAEEIRKTIRDNQLQTLALIGSVDQFTDCVDIVEQPGFFGKLTVMYA